MSWSCARSRSSPSSVPARNCAHSRRQSVQAPSRVPSCLPASIEPTLTTIAGMSARDRAHQLGGNGLVAAADQHHGVERQRRDHLLDVHRHQVAQQHRGRERERLVQRHGREHERQRAGHPHAARDRLGNLRRGLVAGVEVGGGGEDADDRPVERVVGEARALEEAAPQEQRKLLVAVLGEAGPKAFFHGNSPRLKRLALPPLLNCRAWGCQRKKGGPPGGGRNRAGRSNGAGEGGLLTPIVRLRRGWGTPPYAHWSRRRGERFKAFAEVSMTRSARAK